MSYVIGEVDLARGVHDDNLEGAILTKIAQGDLVKVPFPSGAGNITAGTATATSGASNQNTDGSMAGVTLTVPGGVGQSATLRCPGVYGRTIGVRWQRTANLTNPPFTLAVNGVAYPIRNTGARKHAATAASGSDREAMFVVSADLLSDGPHTVEVILNADPAGASRSIVLYGLLVEASKGYNRPGAVASINSVTAVTASFASVQSSTVPNIRALYFKNTTAATRTVTLQFSSNDFKVIQLAAAGTAPSPLGNEQPDSATVTFPQSVPLTNLTVKADAVGVNMWTLSGEPLR